MRVLYITGWCRSGSTILANLLGELPGVVHLGEAHYLWRNGVLGTGTNRQCGCGAPAPSCPLWSEVVAELVGSGSPTALAERAVRDQRRWLRTRHTGARLAEATGRRPVDRRAAVAVDRMVALYRAVAGRTGADLVIDSSKYPAEAAALCGRADVDVRVLHLVRDPRATANSWRQAKAYIPAMGVARSTAYWTGFNLASDRVGRAFGDRYLRLRYESFVADPQASLVRVLALVDRGDPPPVSRDGTAVLGVNHTITGNPDRLRTGPVRIRADDSWRAALPRPAAWGALVLAAPGLRRYGYLRPDGGR